MIKKVVSFLLVFLLVISSFSISITAVEKDDISETGAERKTYLGTDYKGPNLQEPYSEYNFGSTISISGSIRYNSASGNKVPVTAITVPIKAYLDKEDASCQIESKNLGNTGFSFDLSQINGKFFDVGEHDIILKMNGYKYLTNTYTDWSQVIHIIINPASVDTKIDISTNPSSTKYQGQINSIKGNLKTAGGSAIAGATVDVYLDDAFQTSITTTDSGFTYDFTNPIVGDHKVTFKFAGGTIGDVEYNAAEDKVCEFTVKADEIIAFTDVEGPNDGVLGDTFTVKGKLNSAIAGIKVRAYLDEISDNHFLGSTTTEREYDWGYKAKEFSISFSKYDNGDAIPVGPHTVYLVSNRQEVNNVWYEYVQDEGSTFNISAQDTPKFTVSTKPSDGYRLSTYTLKGNLVTKNGQVIEGATVKAYLDDATSELNLIGTYTTSSNDFEVTYTNSQIALSKHSIILVFDGDTIGGVQYLSIRESYDFNVKEDEKVQFEGITSPSPQSGVATTEYSIKGKLVPTSGDPIKGLVVKAYLDEEVLDKYLGQATTDTDWGIISGTTAKEFTIKFGGEEKPLSVGTHKILLVCEEQEVNGKIYEYKTYQSEEFTVSAQAHTKFNISTQPKNGYTSSTITIKGNLQEELNSQAVSGATVYAYLDSTENAPIDTITTKSSDFTVTLNNVGVGTHKVVFVFNGQKIGDVEYLANTQDSNNFTITEGENISISIENQPKDVKQGADNSIKFAVKHGNNYLKDAKVKAYLDEKVPEKYIGEATTDTSLIQWTAAATINLTKLYNGENIPVGEHSILLVFEGQSIDGIPYLANELYSNKFTVSFTVSFQSNGGSKCDSITKSSAIAVEELPIPTRENYVFKGWYFDNEFTQPVEEPFAHSCTLYARWNSTITYDCNGGYGVPEGPQEITSTIIYTELPTPKKDGYVFKGWSTSKDQATFVTEDITGTIILYAIWEEEQVITPDPSDKYPTENEDPIYVLGAQTRATSKDEKAGLRFLIRISNQYKELTNASYGCALFAKDSFVNKYGEEAELLATSSDDKGNVAGKELIIDKCYDYIGYNTYSVVITSDNFVEGNTLYETDFIARPYVKYIDGNNKEQYIYYNEIEEGKSCGKGYFTNYKYVLDNPLKISQNVQSKDEGLAQTGASDNTYILGDAYEDGDISIIDATYIQKCLVGQTDRNLKLYDAFRFKADADQDNKIDIRDATAIQQKLAKITSSDIGNTFNLPIDELDGGLWSPLSR